MDGEAFIKLCFYFFIAPFWIAWKILEFLIELGQGIHLRHQARQYEAQQEQKKADQEQKNSEVISKFSCGTCNKPVGSNFRKGSKKHIKTADLYFCSNECHAAALASSEPYAITAPYQYGRPLPLSLSERELLVGKSSGGMHFEAGRCVVCGQVLDDKAEFDFCSSACKTKAMRPFLPVDFNKWTLDEDYDYKRVVENIEAVTYGDQDELRKTLKELGSTRSRQQILNGLEQMKNVREAKFKQKLIDRENSALHDYQEKWSKQRDYILSREEAKESEKRQKEEAKLSEQYAKEEAKRIEQANEEARWKPKPFNV